MRISDWSSDVCSSDLSHVVDHGFKHGRGGGGRILRIQGQHGDAPRSTVEQLVDRTGDRWRTVAHAQEIGRASCRERVCQSVQISVVAVSLTKNKNKHINPYTQKQHTEHTK